MAKVHRKWIRSSGAVLLLGLLCISTTTHCSDADSDSEDKECIYESSSGSCKDGYREDETCPTSSGCNTWCTLRCSSDADCSHCGGFTCQHGICDT